MKVQMLLYLLSILEGFYLVYMFEFFKIMWSIHHPSEIFMVGGCDEVDFFKHSMNSTTYENKICPFGTMVACLFFIWFLLRNTYIIQQILNIYSINIKLIALLFVGTLITNLNAFIYAMPIFIMEIIKANYNLTTDSLRFPTDFWKSS